MARLEKIIEKILVKRLWTHAEENGCLSPSQYGFRKGRSTVEAIEKVVAIVEGAAEGTWRTRRIPVVVCLNVQNAFNSMDWGHIFSTLEANKFPTYLTRMVQEYFLGRKVVGETVEGEFSIDIARGVPQGSVMGPLLWNLAYDGVLRIKYPEGVVLVVFADNLALVIVLKTEDDIEEKVTSSVGLFARWMEERSLRLSLGKIQIVCMAGRRKLRNMVFTLSGTIVRPTDSIKYRGSGLI